MQIAFISFIINKLCLKNKPKQARFRKKKQKRLKHNIIKIALYSLAILLAKMLNIKYSYALLLNYNRASIKAICLAFLALILLIKAILAIKLNVLNKDKE